MSVKSRKKIILYPDQELPTCSTKGRILIPLEKQLYMLPNVIRTIILRYLSPSEWQFPKENIPYNIFFNEQEYNRELCIFKQKEIRTRSRKAITSEEIDDFIFYQGKSDKDYEFEISD